MKFQYYFQEPDLIVKNIDIQTVSRPKSYRHSFRNGRTKHGFIYIVSGAMEDVFSTEGKKSLICRAGELIFISVVMKLSFEMATALVNSLTATM